MVQKIEKVENPQTYYYVFEYPTYPRQKQPAWQSDLRMFDSVEQAENWIKCECAINHGLRKSRFKISKVQDIEFVYE